MKELKHAGNRSGRRADLMPERVFADEWIKENERVPAVNFGLTALELILNTRQPYPTEEAPGHDYQADIDHPTQRDAMVAASIIQWLGTNCGKCFLDRAERRIKQENNREREVFHARYNVGTRNPRQEAT
ncbi:MAG: hypothetical protein AABN95_16220 [Acidobacteriota bacterium]